MKTRQIGFLDYQLDNYHANVFLDLLNKDLKTRGWKVSKCWAMDEKGGKKWAAEKNIPYVKDVREMGDCDGIMILAPSNPETHLELTRLALPLGLPLYVDKTFTPDYQTAKMIFALADQRRVPLITSSALRCCASLKNLVTQLGKEKICHMRAWGGGGSFGEYAVQPIEMVVSVMGHKIRRVMHLANGPHHQIQMEFSGGRTASVFVHIGSACNFQAMVTTNEKTVHVDCNSDPIFRDLCSLILDFFEARRENIDRRESLVIHRILDVAFDKRKHGRFVAL